MGVEFLEFDLGFEAVLGFHDYIHQFVAVIVPFLDSPEVAAAAFAVDKISLCRRHQEVLSYAVFLEIAPWLWYSYQKGVRRFGCFTGI